MNYNVNRKKCLKLTYGNTKNFISFLILNIIIYSIQIFSVFVIKDFIDGIGKNNFNISYYVITFITSIVLLLVLFIVRNKIKSNICNNVSYNLIKDAYSSMLNSDINELEKPEVKVAINNLVDNSEYIANEYIRKEVLELYEIITGIVLFAFSGLFIQTILTLICIASLAFYYLSIKTVEFTLKRSMRKEQVLTEEINSYINKSFSLVKDIKLKNGDELENKLFCDRLNLLRKSHNKKDLSKLIALRITNIVYICVCISVVLGFGGLLYNNASYDFDKGGFAYFIIVIPIIYELMYKCLHKKVSLSNIDKQNNELNVLYSIHSESKTEPIANLDDVKSLEFKNVCCADSTKKEVVSNISLKLEKNEKLAILCDSKKVKDAIYYAINKLNKVSNGIIEINGCDINKIRTPYLRSLITSLDYDTNIFNKSIQENIIFPNELDEYKYNDALNKTGLKELISYLPNGDKTVVDSYLKEMHKDIIDRIIFANAIYKDSKIYLLNDVSKNLDFDTEKFLFDRLNNLKNKMIINITDKVYLLSNYDKILIIDEGKLIEYGKYDDLMYDKSSELYKRVKSVKIKRTQNKNN